MVHFKKKIFVAGHKGMVGSAICRELAKKSNVKVITRTSSELDLKDQQNIKSWAKKYVRNSRVFKERDFEPK